MTRCFAAASGPSVTLFLIARLFRFLIAVPATAFVLHFAQPELPWWSWCGVAALSLLFVWCVDGVTALVRRRHPPLSKPASVCNAENRRAVR